MRTEYVEAIFSATVKVFSNMLQLVVDRGEVQIREDFFAGNKVNISIGVTGDLKGMIVFSFPEEMVLEIVTQMAGMEINQLDKFVTSAIGEMANIISGQAMSNFAQSSSMCDIIPPQVTIGDDISITMMADQVLTLSLQTTIGDFELHVSLG